VGGRIVELLRPPHRAAEALMPWRLNGTLTPTEKRRLDAHLHECEPCRVEFERQRNLGTLYREAAAAGPDADSQNAFARLAARLDAEAPPPARRAVPTFALRLVTALQFCAIAALIWTLWLVRPDIVGSDEATATYRGLAATASTTRADAVVFFADDAAEVEIRRVLRQTAARIVDGPTAAGAYLLQFKRGASDSTVAELRRERIVVRVESLSAGDDVPSPHR
jgi:anti-sigma factor RsiW